MSEARADSGIARRWLERLRWGLPALVLLACAAGWWQYRAWEGQLAQGRSLAERLWREQPPRFPLEGLNQNWVAVAAANPLAIFDPGEGPWLAAAYYLQLGRPGRGQDQLAYDFVASGRQMAAHPAWLLQVFLPLLAVLLLWRDRDVLPTWPRHAVELLERAAPAVGLAILFSALAGGTWLGYQGAQRLLLLLAFYLVYAMAALGWSRTVFRLAGRQMGLGAIALFWLFQLSVARPLTVNLAANWQPLPTLGEFIRVLDQETRMGYLGADPQPDRERRYLAEAMAKYKVQRPEDLPINLSAFILQREERHAREIFRRRVSELRAKFERQENFERWVSVLFPPIAIQLASASLANSDGAAERWQLAEAESRWDLVTGEVFAHVLAEAGPEGKMAPVGGDYWAKLPSLEPGAAPIGYSLGNVYLPLGALLAGAILLSWRERREAAA
ncbi:MAG: DUF3526 domain-containing protein [Bryobacter sp.]|nr:DUF3526 domain-containing protein [Bryobacter sp.]